jgi:glycosyltransferase involved in cell wall biosynthesis
MTKLKVLIVPDSLTWILGVWANQIVKVGTKHDYYFFTQQMLPYYGDEWKRLLNIVDVVHFLSPYDRDKFAIPDRIPKINSINHVVFWDNLAPYAKADGIMVVADEWKEYLHNKGIPLERLFLLRNGVDTTRFYPLNDKQAARQHLGINSSAKLLGFSAKYTSNEGGRKGVDIFVEAIKRVAASGQKFGVVITGPGWGEAATSLENEGIEVNYRPFLPDELMPSFYNALDLYTVCSRCEGGPAPLLESMACGTPVVTTPVGLAIEYIEDGVNGLMVPKEDVAATAQAIVRMLESDEMRDRCSQAGLRTIRENLTWDKTLAKVEQMYELVWQQAGHTKPCGAVSSIAPEAQRQWVAKVDPYLWYLNLMLDGYFQQGWQGLQECSPKVEVPEKLALLGKTPIVMAKNQMEQLKGVVNLSRLKRLIPRTA